MDRDTLIFQMERYLNGVQDSVDVDCDFGTSAAERFILNTGKRLRNAWILYRREPAYKDDFLLALRGLSDCDGNRSSPSRSLCTGVQ